MPKHLQAFICCFVLFKIADAQNTFVQDTTGQYRVAAAVLLAAQLPPVTSALYNGREYIRYSPIIQGHAYFVTSEWQSAAIQYDGISYAAVPALYDIVKDELVIQHFNGFTGVQLVKEKLGWFSMANHRFVQISADSTQSHQLPPGFYDILQGGNTMLLAKRVKTIKEQVTSNQITSRFEEKDLYFIRRQGRYYAVKNAKTLIDALSDKRKEVQRFLRKHKLKFRKAPETTLVKAVAFYNAPNN